MCTIYHIFVVMSVLAATLLTRQISANINYYYLLDTKWAEWAKKRSILKWIFNTSVICIVLLLVYVTFNKIMKKQLTTWTLSLSLALCDSFFFGFFGCLHHSSTISNFMENGMSFYPLFSSATPELPSVASLLLCLPRPLSLPLFFYLFYPQPKPGSSHLPLPSNSNGQKPSK